MKKVLIVVGLVLSMLLLTGCETKEEDKKLILKALKEYDIEINDFKEVDGQGSHGWSMEWCSDEYTYIYKDKNDKLIGVHFNRKAGSDPIVNNIIVYTDVVENEDVEYYETQPEGCPEKAYYYNKEKDKATVTPKYTLKEAKYYVATKAKNGKKYTIEEK